MTAHEQDSSWGDDWSVDLRLWVERAGRPVLGPGRFELFDGIERTGSIRQAARQLGMSYRRAWLLVKDANEAAGGQLVAAAPGGSHGGGAHLTPAGRQAMLAFSELQRHVRQAVALRFRRPPRAPGTALVHVAAAVSLEEVVGQLLADYAVCSPSTRVRAVFGASDELADQILAGAPADLLLSADSRQTDRLAAAGLAGDLPPAALAGNGLAAIAPAAAAVPVRRPGDLLRLNPGRITLAGPDCPLGGYTRAYLEGLGLYERVSAGAARADNSRGVVAAVRAGRADVGLVYASDVARAQGCRVLFRVRHPPSPIRYVAAVLARGEQAAPARALLDFLLSPSSAGRFRACGFGPVAGGPL
jgi:molybdenum ABC transporter molybdate-binding protein